jgi:hypothetical protein
MIYYAVFHRGKWRRDLMDKLLLYLGQLGGVSQPSLELLDRTPCFQHCKIYSAKNLLYKGSKRVWCAVGVDKQTDRKTIL